MDQTDTSPGIRASQARLTPGAQLGPFIIEAFLGGGADTEVWRAIGDGIVVALKLPRDRSDLFAIARLAHEALALELVRHRNVVHRFDAASDDGDAWLATSLHDAGTLAQLLDDGLLDAQLAAAVLAPIAEALAAAHAVGVVHRDVNTSNILLTADGPILIDFGHAAISGQTWDGWTATGAEAIAVTPGFAPSDTAISPALDIFGIGVTLLEAVTGVRSFADLATQRQRSAVAPIHEIASRCCGESPDDRPTATALATALRALAMNTLAPTQASPIIIDLVRAEELASISTAGRSAELEQLTRFLESCSTANELGAILVVAPAGSGKTWLFETALQAARSDGYNTRSTRCTETKNDLRVLWRIVANEIEDPRLSATSAALLRNGFGATQVPGKSQGATAKDIADAFAEFLALHQTVVFIDDLHLASEELLEIIGLLSFRHGTNGALFLGARPGFLVADDLGVETLMLGPLDDESIRACVLDICGPIHAESATALAHGNPLHALEVAHALDAGIALGDAADLNTVISNRLAAVKPDLRVAIALAAACGHDFWPEALGPDVASRMPHLVKAGYARPKLWSSLGATTEFEWVHPLLREIAYETITDGDRAVIHAQIARVFDDRSDVTAETVAHHACLALRHGEKTVAQIVARQGARAVGEALDTYAVSRAERWVAEIRSTDLDVALADVLDAEVKARQGEFIRALDLLEPHLERDDLTGAKALAVGAQCLVGTGDYERAVSLGTRARDRLSDHPIERVLNSRALAIALRERGCLAEALAELDQASADAQLAEQPLLATRIDVEAMNVMTMLAHTIGDSSEVIRRARTVLRDMQALGDRSGLIDLAASSLVDSIAIEDPVTAHAIQLEAFEITLESADTATTARVARRLVEVSWDAERPDTMLRALAYVNAPGLSVQERSYFALITDLSRTAAARPDHDLGDRLSIHVRAIDAIADAAFSDQHMALCAYAYAGRLSDLKAAFAEFHGQRPLPLLFEAFSRLNIAILSGPPFDTPAELSLPVTTAFHNELALLKYLGGDQAGGDQLLRERHEFLISTGNTHQGYGPTFCGALFSALGPSDCLPATTWVQRQLQTPPLPGIWTFQRALVGLLLAERGDADGELYAASARSLRSLLQLDTEVQTWFDPRLKQLR